MSSPVRHLIWWHTGACCFKLEKMWISRIIRQIRRYRGYRSIQGWKKILREINNITEIGEAVRASITGIKLVKTIFTGSKQKNLHLAGASISAVRRFSWVCTYTGMQRICLEHPIVCCFLLAYEPRLFQGVMAVNWKRVGLHQILGRNYLQ